MAIIYVHSIKHSEKASIQNRLYKVILQVAAFSLFVDIFSRFDGHPGTYYSIFNYWGNLLVFQTNLLLPSLWLLYVHNQVFRNEKRTKRLFYFLAVFNILNAVIIFATRSTGWFFYIDSGNIYHRGPLFRIPVAILIALMLSAFVLIVLNRKKIEPKYYSSLVFFAIPPFICIILQALFYGISLMLNSVVLSLLIIYFNIQNRYIYTDYLTGISNRKRLESLLKGKIDACNGNNTFSAILIDMDNFKSINDHFGHDTGDDALATFVNLLKTCLGPGDFIARFGGDEFYILLNVSDQNTLESTVSRIKEKIRTYNNSLVKPYKLEFSLGYAVYDPDSKMKMDEFQKQLDMLMYANKKLSKENSSIRN